MPRPPTPPRAVYLDLDGTLLDPQRRIHPANLAMLHRLGDTGTAVGIATGRMEASAAPHAQAIRARAPWILYNGARIVDPGDGRVLHAATLPEAVARTALERARAHGVHVNLYADEQLCIERVTPTAQASMDKDGVQAHPVGDLLRWLAGPVTKLLLIAPDPVLDRLEAELAEDLAAQAALVRPEATYLEVLPPGESKGAALVRVARHMRIPPREIVTFGDGPNDLEMVEVAGIGIAMGNAHPSLQRVAQEVIGGNDGDAIARALGRLFALEGSPRRDGTAEDPPG